MSFRDDLLAVLTGGLGALGGGGSTTTTPVEEVPPEPQLADTEPFRLARGNTQAIVFGGAALLGILALVLVLRR